MNLPTGRAGFTLNLMSNKMFNIQNFLFDIRYSNYFTKFEKIETKRCQQPTHIHTFYEFSSIKQFE